MTKSLHAFILLTVLLWQSWVTVGVLHGGARGLDSETVAALVQDADPASDLSLHLDADEAPIQHVHSDGGSGASELLSATWPELFLAHVSGLPEFLATLWRSAPLDDFLRPPRAST